MQQPDAARLKHLRDFVEHCEKVTVPGVVLGSDHLRVVRELLLACEKADQPAATDACAARRVGVQGPCGVCGPCYRSVKGQHAATETAEGYAIAPPETLEEGAT